MLELTYFAARGCCDVIRLALAEASVSYQENIISGLDFQDIEDGIEFGSLPVLHDRDTNFRIVGSKTILSYISMRYGLFGNGLEEHAYCEMWMEACFDTLQQFWSAEFMTKDKWYRSNPLRLKFVDGYLVPKLAKICQMLVLREEFLVGNKFSCAELCLFSLLEALMRELDVVVRSFSVLVEFHTKVKSRTRIQDFCNGPNRY